MRTTTCEKELRNIKYKEMLIHVVFDDYYFFDKKQCLLINKRSSLYNNITLNYILKFEQDSKETEKLFILFFPTVTNKCTVLRHGASLIKAISSIGQLPEKAV